MRQLFSITIVAMLLACSCSSNDKKSETSQHHDAWVASLTDSLNVARNSIEENTTKIAALDSLCSVLSANFEQTSNPKLVEQYVIAKGFTTYDTSSQTGLIARITESGAFELIATNKGTNFDRIEIRCGGESIESEVVAYDKALNHRIGNTNIVAFKGVKADSIGQLINRNKNQEIIVAYKGSKSSTTTLNTQQRQMISDTWNFYDTQRQIKLLERQSMLFAEKCKIIETRINQE